MCKLTEESLCKRKIKIKGKVVKLFFAFKVCSIFSFHLNFFNIVSITLKFVIIVCIIIIIIFLNDLLVLFSVSLI